jgi:MtN3 and saliva related transmembrane protein
MEVSTTIGFIAGALTALATVPQFIKSLKTKETKDVSLEWCILLTVGVFLWMIYGFMIGDMPVIIANAITLIFAAGILILKLKYG